jgi:hypothetical protein
MSELKSFLSQPQPAPLIRSNAEVKEAYSRHILERCSQAEMSVSVPEELQSLVRSYLASADPLSDFAAACRRGDAEEALWLKESGSLTREEIIALLGPFLTFGAPTASIVYLVCQWCAFTALELLKCFINACAGGTTDEIEGMWTLIGRHRHMKRILSRVKKALWSDALFYATAGDAAVPNARAVIDLFELTRDQVLGEIEHHLARIPLLAEERQRELTLALVERMRDIVEHLDADNTAHDMWNMAAMPVH